MWFLLFPPSRGSKDVPPMWDIFLHINLDWQTNLKVKQALQETSMLEKDLILISI